MPYAVNRGVRIYWEEQGTGTPVLLIMGLSFTMDMWFRIVPALATKHRVIFFDNRGVGRSDVPRGPYTMRTLAEDAIAVLNAANVEEPVHLIGASMGGMISQELALRYPALIRSLVLACTACGPLHRMAWPNFRRSPHPREWLLRGELRERSLIRLLYADGTPEQRIAEDIQLRLVRPPLLSGVLSQFAGILIWSSYSRLPQIHIPTLVVHGDEDHMLPIANGRMIAQRIPGAEFVQINQAGHVLATDQPEICLREMNRFLEQVESRDTSLPHLGNIETSEVIA
jgi:pimeloyl-ACP methyl ester carboxylesterase